MTAYRSRSAKYLSGSHGSISLLHSLCSCSHTLWFVCMQNHCAVVRGDKTGVTPSAAVMLSLPLCTSPLMLYRLGCIGTVDSGAFLSTDLHIAVAESLHGRASLTLDYQQYDIMTHPTPRHQSGKGRRMMCTLYLVSKLSCVFGRQVTGSMAQPTQHSSSSSNCHRHLPAQ